MDRIQIISIVGSVALFIFIVELVRRRKLKVQYAILWLAAAAAVLVLSLDREALEWFARLAGVYYAPAALFMIAILFGILLFIHFSIVISRLSSEHTVLAQRIALLESMLEQPQGKEKGKEKGKETEG
jgi:hypothetical protein